MRAPAQHLLHARLGGGVPQLCPVSGATAFDVRLIESVVTRFIFQHHPDFMAKGLFVERSRGAQPIHHHRGRGLPGPRADAPSRSASPSAPPPDAVERVAVNAARMVGEPDHGRSPSRSPGSGPRIHLDMVFTDDRPGRRASSTPPS
ncbi:MAG: hypothetical protein MZV65_15965 [Chromatiales bacterium]|nr:hypothetical protein [Chromatiales bacterium]